MAALSCKKPASTGISCDACCAQEFLKTDNLFVLKFLVTNI
jgi:hypothetical protein